MIALMDLGRSIKFVVDSAPFKQNKYTPGTHVPIFSPDVLHTKPVAAIIVMAASYSDEVAKTIHARFGNKFTVSILRDFGLELVSVGD
jgi:hypothetical protein